MQSRNLTIMLTDVKGFTSRASSQSRQALMDMLKEHNDLLMSVVDQRGGKLIKTIGDALLVTFESPTDAVLAGMAIQDALRQHNVRVPAEEQIELRVAINTGEVTIEDGDVFGEAVNITSRIEGIAEPNEVYFTEATYLSMNKTEVPSAEIGYRILRGIPEKIKIYKVLKEGETPPVAPHTVPHTVAETVASMTTSTPAVLWRRGLAFAIDAVLVFLVVQLILIPASTQLRRARDNFERRFSEIHSLLSEEGFDRDQIGELIYGDEAPTFGVPHLKMVLEVRGHAGYVKKLEGIRQKGTVVLWNVLFFLYNFVMLGLWSRTLGKMLLRTRILRTSGEKLSWSIALARTLLYILSALPLGLGFFRALFDPKRQTWHDKTAKTQVVSEVLAAPFLL